MIESYFTRADMKGILVSSSYSYRFLNDEIVY